MQYIYSMIENNLEDNLCCASCDFNCVELLFQPDNFRIRWWAYDVPLRRHVV